ncbi:CCA tRNA nucleotidyltransferase [Paenibacillus sp. TSA_86.1]|uniref:CCA tRNA nucleotidyltransferase n=1 Tax=Paenibacillus sp. TSA_86.1 TaxID=3415649 RepID=UPI00404557C6
MVQWTQADGVMAKQSEDVLHRLNEHGFEAYWVGGCVRDEILGRAVDDMDITTSASPEQVMALFDDCIPTGLQHGTVTVRSGGYYFEVTTFRTESEYRDNRRPAAVQFVQDIKEDLERRDFTMNALAMDVNGAIVDPFGGQKDIKQGLVRCVGLAVERFGEDALRMLRCVRFASVFDFRIAHHTWRGLVNQRKLLQHIAMERVRTEMVKMMAGPHPLKGLELLFRSQALEYVKAPVDSSRFNKELLVGLQRLSGEHVLLRWSCVLLAGGYNREEADKLLRQWTFSNEQRVRITGILQVEQLVTDFVVQCENERMLRESWIVTVLTCGAQAANDWLLLQEQLPKRWREGSEQTHDRLVKVQTHAAGWSQSMPVHEIKELEITGEQVLQLVERKGGPWLGQLMKHLLRETAIGNIMNQHEALRAEVKREAANDQA